MPVRGKPANEIYLRHLLTVDGKNISWSRIGSTGASNIDNPIDVYSIKDEDGKNCGSIFISPYHKRISVKAPKGFIYR